MEKLTQRLTREEIETITDIDKLKQVLRIYSKAANTRLRALEKAELTNAPAYQAVRDLAYDDFGFMGRTKKGEFKFRTNTRGMELDLIRAELLKLDTFLFRAHTSTVTGAKTARQKIREATINQTRSGTKSERISNFFSGMKQEVFDEFWDYQNLKRLIDIYGTDEAVRIIEAASDNPNIGSDLSNIDRVIGELLDNVLADIINDNEKSLTSLYDALKEFKPVGSVT